MRFVFLLLPLLGLLPAIDAPLREVPSPPTIRVGTAGSVTYVGEAEHWSAGTVVQLDGPVAIVRDGVLRIDAGTRVEAAIGAFIVVTREGTIEADGTLERPIVLTCATAAHFPGCWGGLIVQGNARLNSGAMSSTATARGGAGGCRESIDPVATALAFGGCNDADSSGFLRYLRIEHAERGLQLQGVGRATVVHHVQANRSRFEGLLAIGGTVRVRELFLTANGIGLRWTGGWRGEAQAIAIQQDVSQSRGALIGQNAVAADGDADAMPRSAPTLHNLTILAQSIPSNPFHASARAILLEHGTAGTLRNVFLYAPQAALDIADEATCGALNSGALSLASIVTAGATSLEFGSSPASCTLSEAAVLADASAQNIVLPSAAGLLKSLNDLILPDLRPVSASALARATAASVPVNGFFTGPAFVGAVPAADVPAQIPWFAGWTDPAPQPAPIPSGSVSGFVRSPFRGYLPNVVVHEATSGQSTATSANAAYSLLVAAGTVLLEVDNLPTECTAPPAHAATIQPGTTTVVELLVDCWPFAAAARLAPGSDFMCAISKEGPRCWGENGRGQLGIGNTTDSLLPVIVPGGFTSITAGVAHACGRTSAGDARCWGAGDAGQLGDGSSLDRLTPVPVSGGHRFLAVSAGDRHTCGVKSDGSIWCWGTNDEGQLGTGSTAGAVAPTRVQSVVNFALVDAGSRHSCALDRAGAAWCWGAGTDGQLGDGTAQSRLAPVAVATSERFAALTVSGSHACGTTATGVVRCWGVNVNGALGDGTDAAHDTPTTTAFAGPLAFVAAGADHTCALPLTAIARCWGANAAGQLGIGSTASAFAPVTVPYATSMSSLATGPDYTCGVTRGAVTGTGGNTVVISAHALLCWGSNAGGQFGRGDRLPSATPVGAAFGILFY